MFNVGQIGIDGHGALIENEQMAFVFNGIIDGLGEGEGWSVGGEGGKAQGDVGAEVRQKVLMCQGFRIRNPLAQVYADLYALKLQASQFRALVEIIDRPIAMVFYIAHLNPP